MFHLKSKFDYKIVYSVKEINVEHWNLIKSNNIFLALNYLETIEKTVSEVHQFIYVIYYDKEKKPIGKSIFQLLQYDTSTFNFDSIPCGFQNKVLRHLLHKKLSILIVGNIFATGENAFQFKDTIDNKLVFKAINEVVDVLIRENKEINYALFKEFYPNAVTSSYLEKTHQYLKFNIDVNMVLKLKDSWQNFDGLLVDFKTKYRSRFKNVLLKSKELVVKQFSLEDMQTHAATLENLYQQVIQNSDFNIGVFNIETFLSLKENLHEHYSVFGYFVDEKLIGFRTAFIDNKVLEASFIGIDYSQNLKYDLYQRMLIDYINYGIQHKVVEISFGRTAETIKCCVGAEPISMNLFVRSRKKIGMFLLKLIVNNIKPTEFSRRQPFKKAFYSVVS